MNLSDLSPDEQLALVGLLRQVIGADGVLSDDERGAIRGLADRVGRPRWEALLGRAREELTSRAALDGVVAGVVRPEAREAIYAVLLEVADSDAVVLQEARILDHLARVWELGAEAPLTPPHRA